MLPESRCPTLCRRIRIEVTTPKFPSAFDSPEQVAFMSCIAPRDGAVRHHKPRGDQVVRKKPNLITNGP